MYLSLVSRECLGLKLKAVELGDSTTELIKPWASEFGAFLRFLWFSPPNSACFPYPFLWWRAEVLFSTQKSEKFLLLFAIALRRNHKSFIMVSLIGIKFQIACTKVQW